MGRVHLCDSGGNLNPSFRHFLPPIRLFQWSLGAGQGLANLKTIKTRFPIPSQYANRFQGRGESGLDSVLTEADGEQGYFLSVPFRGVLRPFCILSVFIPVTSCPFEVSCGFVAV